MRTRPRGAVIGVGQTDFGVFPQASADDLAGWAYSAALADAGLRSAQIDGLVTVRTSGYQAFATAYGIEPTWVAELPAHGRMASNALITACAAIEAGLCTTVALVYGNTESRPAAPTGAGARPTVRCRSCRCGTA